MSAPQKPSNPKLRLELIAESKVGAVVSAPPVLIASTHTVDYLCGHCDTVLMHAEQGQVHNLVIHCVVCGSYNKTDS